MFFFFSFLISSLVPSASSGLTLYGRSGRSAPLCYTNSFSRKKSTRIRHLYISPFSTLLYLLLDFGIPDGSAQRRILLLSERQRVHFFSLHLTILRHLDVRFIREFLCSCLFFLLRLIRKKRFSAWCTSLLRCIERCSDRIFFFVSSACLLCLGVLVGLAWRVGFYPLRSVCVMFAFWISSICSHLGATGVGRSLLGNLDGGNDTCLHCWVCDDIVLIFGLTLAWHFLWRVCLSLGDGKDGDCITVVGDLCGVIFFGVSIVQIPLHW